MVKEKAEKAAEREVKQAQKAREAEERKVEAQRKRAQRAQAKKSFQIAKTGEKRSIDEGSAPNSSGLLIRILNRTRSDQFRTSSSSIYSVQD